MFGVDDIVAGAAIGGLGKLVTGAYQRSQAKKLKEDTYIPPEALENKKIATLQANQTQYAGQNADEARNNQVIANSVNNLQRNAKSAGDIINTSANIEAGLGNQMANQIASRYQQFKQNALNRLQGANQTVAAYQDRNHQQYLNYKRQLQGAGLQNIWGAVNDVSGGIASNGFYNKIYGNGAINPMRLPSGFIGDANVLDNSEMYS